MLFCTCAFWNFPACNSNVYWRTAASAENILLLWCAGAEKWVKGAICGTSAVFIHKNDLQKNHFCFLPQAVNLFVISFFGIR